MTNINFPNYGDSGYEDGISCDTYAWGWVSSGCTDENGDYRGFTQEWYYDENIGAWVALTEDGGGGGLDVQGGTYEGITHATPEWVAGGTGIMRKVTFLDPTTGSLTFDYIRMYDIVGPTESRMLHSGSVPGYRAFDSTVALGNRLGRAGVTLCAPGDFVYVWWENGNTNPLITETFNVDPDTGEISPFNPGAPSSVLVDYATTMNGTEITADGPGGLTLPALYSAANGTNNLLINDYYIAFTADGPTNKALMFSTFFTKTDGTGNQTNTYESYAVSTENYYYMFVTSGSSMDYWTGDLIKAQAQGNTALQAMLPSNSTGTSHSIQKDYSTTDFNMAAVTNSGYLFVAFPTRSNITTPNLYYTPSAAQGNGFDPSFTRELTITNDYGYGETYKLFRSDEPNGLNVANTSQVFKINTLTD